VKRFSPRLFAAGLVLGALGTAAVLAASTYAGTARETAAPTHVVRPVESGQLVIDWNQILLSIVNTPGAQPANIQPTRSCTPRSTTR
jgi:hypothetical protein